MTPGKGLALACLLGAAAARPLAGAALGPPTVLHDLSRSGNAFVATGSDPFVVFAVPTPIDGPGMFVFEAQAKAQAGRMVTGQLFTVEAGSRPFREERSVKFPLAADGRWHHYTVAMPGTRVARVRLDPFAGSGELRLGTVAVEPAPGPVPFDGWGARAISRTMLPGPGLEDLGDGAYRPLGPGAYLTTPHALAIDASVVSQVEVALQADAPVAARLCYASEPLGVDAGCADLGLLSDQPRTRYVELFGRPGWTGTIRRLRLDFVEQPRVGESGGDPPELRVTWFRAVPVNREAPASSFALNVDRMRARDPTGVLGIGLAALGVLLVAASFAVRRAGAPIQGLLAATHTGAILLLFVSLAIFPFERCTLWRAPLLFAEIDPPWLLALFASGVALARMILEPEREDGAGRRRHLRELGGAAVILLAALALTSWAAQDRGTSLAYGQRYYLPFVATFACAVATPISLPRFRLALGVILVGLSYISAMGIVQALGAKDVVYGPLFRTFQPLFFHANLRPKAFSSIGHPVPLATLLVALLPLAMAAATAGLPVPAWLGRIAAALGLACLVLTMSRGAYLALLTALPISLGAIPRGARRHACALGVAVAAASAVVIIVRTPAGPAGALVGPGGGSVAAGPPSTLFVRQRRIGAVAAWRLFLESPLVGGGLGRIQDRYGDLLRGEVEDRSPSWSTAENQYLTLLGEAGVLGVLAYALFLAVLLVRPMAVPADAPERPLARAVSAGLVAFSVHLLFWDGLYWYTVPVMTAGALGLAMAGLATARAWPQPSGRHAAGA